MTPKFKKRSQFNTDVNFWGFFVGMHGSYIYMKAYYYIYTETNPISFLVEMKGVEICRKYPGFIFDKENDFRKLIYNVIKEAWKIHSC